MSSIREATNQFAQVQSIPVSWSKVIGISAAVLLGAFIVFAVGFAAPEIIHNAAHDVRHGMTFPCH